MSLQLQARPTVSRRVPALVPTASPGELNATYLPFVLFVITNAVLFIRPAEYVSDFLGQRLFLGLMALCLFLGFPVILAQLLGKDAGKRPLLILPLLLWPFIVLSDLGKGRLDEAVTGFLDFARVLPYYLLMVGLLLSPERLRWMLGWLTGFTGVIAVIAVLQYHEIIHLELFQQLQDNDVKRLRATGIFQDPNDFGALLSVAVLGCLFFLLRGSFLTAPFWLGLAGLFVYSILLTHSRGTLLALGAGIFVLLRARVGTFSALALGSMLLPGLLLFSSRGINLSSQHDTAMSRVEHWSDAMQELQYSPIFGTGYNNLQELIGLVAHNSYMHAFAELGLIGGCVFLGIWAYSLWAMFSLTANNRQIVHPELAALHPTMTAILLSYMVSIFSLSLCYVHPTYAILGMVAAYLHMTRTRPEMPTTSVNERFGLWLLGLGILFLVFMRVFIPVMRLLGG